MNAVIAMPMPRTGLAQDGARAAVPSAARTSSTTSSATSSRPRRAPHMTLTRRGRGVVVLVALGVALAVGSGAQRAEAGAPAAAIAVSAHVVAPGDTLWEIAAATAGPGEDVRDVLHRIKELNGLRSVELAVGQKVLVPQS